MDDEVDQHLARTTMLRCLIGISERSRTNLPELNDARAWRVHAVHLVSIPSLSILEI